MREEILILILTIVFIMGFGVSASESPKLLKAEWQDEGTASAYILSASYDDAWEKALDVILFEKFKLRGAIGESIHEALVVEKETGLIVVKGHNNRGAKYTVKITLRKKNCNVLIQCRSDSAWKKKVVERFFLLFEKKFKV